MLTTDDVFLLRTMMRALFKEEFLPITKNMTRSLFEDELLPKFRDEVASCIHHELAILDVNVEKKCKQYMHQNH